MENLISLCSLKVGECADVHTIELCINIRRRLMDLGLTQGAQIKCVGISPCGDPHAYLIRGAIIAIRNADAIGIRVKKVSDCYEG